MADMQLCSFNPNSLHVHCHSLSHLGPMELEHGISTLVLKFSVFLAKCFLYLLTL